MLRVYAKIRFLIILFSVCLLAGCGGGGGYSMPWGSTNVGIVTDDPESIPNIAWQTPDQLQVLAAQNREMMGQQVGPVQDGTTAVAPIIPVVKDAPREKVTVSILLPLSGKKAALGQSMMKAAQMALFDIGSADFELVPRDTKGTPEGAVAAANAAIKNNSSLILGPVFAEELRAIKPVTTDAGIPVISFTTDWTLAGDNTYIMGFLPFTQVARVVKYAQERGYSRLGVYAPQTEYSDVVISTLHRTGVSVVRTSRYAQKQMDMSELIKDFVETSRTENGYEYDMLMLPIGSEGLRSIVQTMAVHGLDQSKVKFIGTGLWDDTALMNDPALFKGWFSAPDPNLRADFEKHYQENYGEAPMRLASLAYDATALAAVLARTPHSGSAYSYDTLTNPRGFAGIDGIFRFRSDGLSERGLAVLEVQPGRPRVIDPAPSAFISSGS